MKVHGRSLYGRTYFTDGPLREFEREMQYAPGFTKTPQTEKERDCRHCLHWNSRKKVCKQERCIVFED